MLRQGGCIQTSVLVSVNFYKLCKEHNIKFSEALRVGISLLLAEKGIEEYDNKLNISRKITLLTKLLEDKSKELEELREKDGRQNTQACDTGQSETNVPEE